MHEHVPEGRLYIRKIAIISFGAFQYVKIAKNVSSLPKYDATVKNVKNKGEWPLALDFE